MSDEGPSHLDLFSGIGGFALAARWSGWRTVAFSEIDPYACRVLERQFPGVPNLGDIRNVRAVRADLVTGGFPCQPYSLAGKRRGTGDDRALWPEMFRVIGETRPTWMLGENVPGIINLELDRVLSDLESIGYAAWPIGIPACAVDARHRRERIWIVAYSEHERWHAAALHRKSASDDRGQTKPEEEAEQSTGSDPLANAHGERREGQRLPIQPGRSLQASAETRRSGSGISNANGHAAERAAIARGQCHLWQPEPGVGRVADGIPCRVDRLRGLGNAIVPQVAAVLLREMRRLTEPSAQ